MNKQYSSNENTLQPWYQNCPTAYFVNEPSHNNAIISEEALSKLIRLGDEISSFDQFLSNWYSNRVYLAVLREINGLATSQVSRSIMGGWRFDIPLILADNPLQIIVCGV